MRKNKISMSLRHAALTKSKQMIVLSERDAEIVFNLIEHPPAPNACLKAAALKHKAFFEQRN